MREFKFDIDKWTGGDTIGSGMGDAVASTVGTYDIKLITAPTKDFKCNVYEDLTGTVDWGDGETETLEDFDNETLAHTYKDGEEKSREITIYINNLDILNDLRFTITLTFIRYSPVNHTKLLGIYVNLKDDYLYNVLSYKQDKFFDDIDSLFFVLQGKSPKTIDSLYRDKYIEGNFEIPDTVETILFGAFNNTVFNNDIIMPASIKKIDMHAFDGAVLNNNKIVLPPNIEKIESYSFNNVKQWKGDLVIPDSIKLIGNNAFNTSDIDGELKLGKGVEYINDFAFNGSRKLKGSIVLPNGLKYIGINAFARCNNLNGTLTIPASVERIDDGAFEDCRKINKLIFEEGNLTRLNGYLFNNCTGLRGTVVLPKSIKAVDSYVFYGCRNLEAIYVPEHITNIPGTFCDRDTKIIKY